MAGSKGIRAGRAFVELFADNTRLMRGLRAAQARMRAFAASARAIGTRLFASGALIAAPLIAAVKHFASAGDQLDKMAARTGISTNALSELGFAAEQSGTNLESIEKAVRRMQVSVYDLAQNSSTAVDAFDALGISLDQLRGQIARRAVLDDRRCAGRR